MKFIGRQEILGELSLRYQDDKADLVLIHGRRRVGKSRLIAEFVRDKKNVFSFTGVEGPSVDRSELPGKLQMRNFLATLSQLTHNPLFSKVTPASWEECLTALDGALPGHDRPCCIVLDELPWMASLRLDLVRALFKIWELKWSRRSRLMLVVCGSSVGFLDKHFIHSTQFYGRATLSVHLSPLTLGEAREFFGPSRTAAEILDLYMVFGGIPQYLEQIPRQDSVRQAINRLCFKPHSFFLEEIDHLFRSSFIRQSHKYKQAVMALVKKEFLSYEQLASLTKSTRGSSLKQIVDNLVHSDFIQKVLPVDKNGESRLFGYTLSDEFSRFYFQFIFPQINTIRQNVQGNDLFDLLFPQNRHDTWKGRTFERLVQKHAGELARYLGLSVVVRNSGPCFSRGSHGVQVDLAYLRSDRTLTACEIKYSDRPLSLDKRLKDQLLRQRTYLERTFPRKRIEQILVTNLPPQESIRRSDLIQRVVVLTEMMG